MTVASGRPVRTTGDYAQSMPTWSQEYGGPLRQDQVRDVVAFIMNWELEDRAGVSAESAAVDDPVARGQSLFNSSGCAACHLVQGVSSGVVGPELTNVFADKGADYIRDSILNPNAAIAEGYTENVMPATLADQLSDADIDDIIAFLENAAQ